jgi:SAM-dependent methyltransferase
MSTLASRAFECAELYEAARPGYPPEAVNWLTRGIGVGPSSVIVDLAAGSGKLTRALQATGATVIAVEPVAGMRLALGRALPGVEVLDGTAEAIPLSDAAADAVTVAQGFHWFRGDEALLEIRRVLRARGGLGLIWNIRDLSQPLQAALDAIVSNFGADVPTRADGRWRDALEATSLFIPLQKREFVWDEHRHAEGLIAFAASLSPIAALPRASREAALDEVRKLTTRLPERFNLRFRTDAYVYKRN